MLTQIIRHGIEHSQYFQGCGVSFTAYDACATGIGATEREAYEDALESIAQCEPREVFEKLESALAQIEPEGWDAREAEGEDQYWHVSVRYTREVQS